MWPCKRAVPLEVALQSHSPTQPPVPPGLVFTVEDPTSQPPAPAIAPTTPAAMPHYHFERPLDPDTGSSGSCHCHGV